SCETTDGWLGDTLDVITQHLSMTLGATLSKPFSSFTTSRHDEFSSENETPSREPSNIRAAACTYGPHVWGFRLM
ncbi:MAG: hypothetical protein GY774_30975, partial [Planctomycetes bacterium]|nr:hypothetical protein [Planctomycetota bacterium]